MKFDLDTYKRRTARLDQSGIDFARFAVEPLDADALRCLRYMHDVEFHTACYLRDLLVTRAHADPDLTTFLTLWAFEELWHGEAIEAVLRAHGEPAGRAALAPHAMAVASATTRHLTAVHMTWGAVNEWTTQAAYGRLAVRAGHPVLSDLLRRIMRQEGRHIDFYATEAHRLLAGSPTARRLTRLALRRLWAPVGTSVMPASEVAHLCQYLFTGPEGTQARLRIDRRIDRLPGLEGLELLERAARRLAPGPPGWTGTAKSGMGWSGMAKSGMGWSGVAEPTAGGRGVAA